MRKPPAYLYPVFVLAIAGSAAFFWNAVRRERARTADLIGHFQRFVAPGHGLLENDPGNHGAAVLEVKEPGEYTVFYESYGVHQEFKDDAGEVFDTPTRQLWPVKGRVAMTLEVSRADGAEQGQKLEVRLAGLEADPEVQKRIEDNPRTATPKNRGLVVYRRGNCGRDGHAVWLVNIPAPGFYAFDTQYVEGVHKDPAAIAVPPELTKEEKKTIPTYKAEAQVKARQEAQQDVVLAQVKPLPVLLALGKDPLGQRMFDPAGLYGAAGLCAFVTTLSLVGMIMVAAMRSRKA